MIDRRTLMCGTATAALAIGAPAFAGRDAVDRLTGLRAGPRDAATRAARIIAEAMPPALRAQLGAHAAAQGWTGPVGPPPLRRLAATIAAEHRAGQSYVVRGLRLSRTELTWYLATAHRTAPAAGALS